jgi:hypothetical protein
MSAEFPDLAHYAVADGLGEDAAGTVAWHLRFCLRHVEDGWFSAGGSGTEVRAADAWVGLEPAPIEPHSMPVILPAAR